MRRYLITNADDVGWNSDINLAAEVAIRAGGLRSFSVMANGQAVDGAMDLGRSTGASVGVHLNVTTGTPVGAGGYSTLLDESGSFRGKERFASRYFLSAKEVSEIEREFSEQIERILSYEGINVSHLDTHHHVARVPAIWNLMVRGAKRYGIKSVRTPKSYRQAYRSPLKNLAETVYRANATREGILSPKVRFGCPLVKNEGDLRSLVLTMLKCPAWQVGSVAELSFHPSMDAGVYGESSSMVERRASDLRILTEMNFEAVLDQVGVELCPYP